MTPLVSVIMPVFNQEPFLAETIESVMNQSFTDFEFLIIDDGSTDKSAEILKAYASKHDKIIAVYHHNRGKCISTNSLVSQARGKFLAFLDADDLMMPNRLEKQVAFHLANTDVDASSSNCLYINGEGRSMMVQRFDRPNTVEECRRISKSGEFIRCSFTALMTTRESFQESGGLLTPFWPCEDFEFVNRLLAKNYVLLIMNEVLMKYRIHSTAITVKNPLFTYDKVGYCMHCLTNRRAGLPEITFEEFMQGRTKDSWFVKFNRRRYNYSQIYFRKAGFSLMSRKYLDFSWQFISSFILEPGHMFLKMKQLLVHK